MVTSALLAARLPDVPRWVEVRALLLEGCDVYGFAGEMAFVVREAEPATLFVVGSPDPRVVQEALRQLGQGGQLIAAPQAIPWLAPLVPGWSQKLILVHELHAPLLSPDSPSGSVAMLTWEDLRRAPLPDDLREELEDAAARTEIVATFVGERPVSFCYAGAVTESLWDVSIDTLPEYRRQGHARHCATYLIRQMQERGKHPVWQALADNPASWRLAEKMGFVRVDELALFEAPA